jgi:hypothetical protein
MTRKRGYIVVAVSSFIGAIAMSYAGAFLVSRLFPAQASVETLGVFFRQMMASILIGNSFGQILGSWLGLRFGRHQAISFATGFVALLSFGEILLFWGLWYLLARLGRLTDSFFLATCLLLIFLAPIINPLIARKLAARIEHS